MNRILKEWYKARYIYLYLCIPFSLVGLLIFYPFARGIEFSFLDWNGAQVSDFVGFGNYKELFTNDPLFGRAIGNILILSLVYIAHSIIVSLLIAWTIHHIRSQRSKYVFRIFVILPSLIPSIVGWLIWKKFYDQDGLVNRLLDGIGLEQLQHSWLGDTSVVLFAIAFAGFPWVNGANTLIFLAGLLQIPKEMYEAAKMDGSSAWKTFWHLEAPFVAGQTRILMVLSLIFALQNYDNVFILTQGGPMDASVVPGILLYKNAFLFGRYGYASTIGVFVFLFVLLLSLMSMRLSRQNEGASA